jgi:hypothetical protein
MKQGKRSDRSQRLVVVEPDDGLRQILVHELSARFPNTTGVTWDEFLSSLPFDGALLAAMFDEKSKIEAVLTDGQQCIYLKGRSVASAMSDQQRPASGEVIAVVSGWEGFISFARVMLLAANIEPGNLVCRSTGDDGWQDAIGQASMVICDSLTADRLNGDHRTRTFQVISDESLREISSLLHG